ncbi:MAG: MptD family putative ECF transporter S component [Ruminococcus sp.]|nr:MptD family putative ECF transporter S component [Ruminococcus sp.]
MEKKMKLEVKDLMTIGIFATIYIVVKIIVGFVGVIPILCVILPMITAVVCAPIYMLFVTKAEKFGMITLLAAVVGAVMMIAGYGWLTLVVSFVCGLLADVMTNIGNKRSFGKILAGYCIFSQWGVAMLAPVWMQGDAYFKDLSETMGKEFSDSFRAMTPPWVIPVLIAGIAVAAVIGGFFGRKIMKKHFERSGII